MQVGHGRDVVKFVRDLAVGNDDGTGMALQGDASDALISYCFEGILDLVKTPFR